MRRRLCVLLLVTGPADGWAAAAGPDPVTTGDVIFYTFSLTAVAFYAIAVLALKQLEWLVYAAYGVLMLTMLAALDGTLAALFQDDWWSTIAPLHIGAVCAGVGFWQAARRLQPDHGLHRLSPVLKGASVLSLLLVPGYFVVPSVFPLYVALNILMLSMFVATTLPPFTWVAMRPAMRRSALASALTLAALIVGVYVAHFAGDGFSPQTLEAVNRGAVLCHIAYLLVFTVLLAFEQLRAQRESERRAAEQARKTAETELALERSQKKYARAKRAASDWSAQLAAASHDIRQPIANLRATLDNLQGDGEAQPVTRLRDAVDYLDQLAGSYLKSGVQGVDASEDSLTFEPMTEERSRDRDGYEAVSIEVLLRTVRRLYSNDAEQAGITLHVPTDGTLVRIHPLSLLRLLSNLIKNVIAHAHATTIEVTTAKLDRYLRLMVHDNGQGMDAATLARVTELRARGEDSDGSGLGLSIVQSIAEEHGLNLELNTSPGEGTRVSVDLPLA